MPVLLPLFEEPASTLATYTTPALLPGYCSHDVEKDEAINHSPDRLSPPASWGSNNFASCTQPAPAPQPAFLSGLLEVGPETGSPRLLPAALVGNNFVSMRGAVLALDPPGNIASVSHPNSGDLSPGTGTPTTMVLPRGSFSLRGALLHASGKPRGIR